MHRWDKTLGQKVVIKKKGKRKQGTKRNMAGQPPYGGCDDVQERRRAIEINKRGGRGGGAEGEEAFLS